MSKDIKVQAQNKLSLVGKLLDINAGSGKLSDGRPYKRATVTIRVTQSYNGKEETSEIPVGLFATEFTSTGKANPAWKSLNDLEQMKSAQNVGIDRADTIALTGASLQENNFVSRSGQLINGWQIRGSFCNVSSKPAIASFNTDIFIMDIKDEEDREGNPTGRLIVRGGIVQYGGKLDVVEFVVEGSDKVDFVSRHWEVNTTVNVRGRIRMTSSEETSSGESSSWGEEVPDTSTRYIRELVITTGDDEGKEEDFAYDVSDIRKAFKERQAMIEQLQIDARNKATATKQSATAEGASDKYSWN